MELIRSITLGEIISSAVLVITFIAVAFYTRETIKMRRNSIRPILATYVRKRKEGWRLIVRNIGNGPAFNVIINDLVYKNESIRYFISENYINPRQELPVSFKIFHKGEAKMGREEYNYNLFPYFNKKFLIEINCEDMDGKLYQSYLKHNKDNRITKMKKTLRLGYIYNKWGCLVRDEKNKN